MHGDRAANLAKSKQERSSVDFISEFPVLVKSCIKLSNALQSPALIAKWLCSLGGYLASQRKGKVFRLGA